MNSAATPVEVADEINAQILAISEDQLQGFQRDPSEWWPSAQGWIMPLCWNVCGQCWKLA